MCVCVGGGGGGGGETHNIKIHYNFGRSVLPINRNGNINVWRICQSK